MTFGNIEPVGLLVLNFSPARIALYDSVAVERGGVF